MKKLLLLLLLAFNLTLQAQTLFTENATALTVGNVGTDLTGVTPGQGGWTTFIATTAVPAGQNTDFQIVDKGGVYGNAIQINGPSATNGTRWMTKTLTTEWAARTSGNNIAEVEYDFFTGPATTSKNTMRMVLYESSARTKMLAGLMVQMDTREIRALGYLDPTTLGGTGAIGNYSLTLGGTSTTPAALILNADTWYRIGLSFNYTTGEIKVKELSGLFNKTYAGAAATNDVGELDILGAAGGTTAAPNAASGIGVYDNIIVRASSTDTLLGVEKNNASEIKFSIYPNPTSNMLTISNDVSAIINNVALTDLNGRIIRNLNVSDLSEVQINISDLAKGIYMMKITSDRGISIDKVIKE